MLSKTVTDKYLKRANEEYFGVRGLRVRLMRDEALKIFCGQIDETSVSSAMAKFGKKAEAFFTTVRFPIVTPIASAVLDAVKPLPYSSSSTSSSAAGGLAQTFAERKIAALQSYISPVTFDVPPSAMPQAMMARASGWAAQRNHQTSQRRLNRDDHRQAPASTTRREMTAYEYTHSLQASPVLNRRVFKDQRRAVRQAYKQERHSMQGRSNGQTERRASMAARRDIRRDENLIWLVVYPIPRGQSFFCI